MRLRDFPAYLLITLPLLYFIVTGGTYNGILNSSMRLFSVILLGVLALLWIVRRRNTPFVPTALDLALPLWAAAFALSLIANTDDWRRIVMGLWYIGVYALLWIILTDVIVRRALSRKLLINALLIVGVVVLYFGYVQFFNELRNPNLIGLPRPVSAFGNPNTLAAFLVMLIPFVCVRAIESKSITRIIMAIYSVLALALLALTFSRAGWIAVVVVVIVAVVVMARTNRTRIQTWIITHRAFAIATLLVILMAGTTVTTVVIASLSDPSRSLDLRAFIYQTALNLFIEQPITGRGLFTFGGGLAALNSTPPTEPHSHAHNIILHVAAELGIIGVIALVVSAVLILRAVWRNYGAADSTEQGVIAAAALAVIGFGTNHLLDMPAMLPSVFITTIFVMSIAAAPVDTPSPTNPRRFTVIPVALGALILFVTGMFGAINYGRYINILSDGASERISHVQAAEAMQSVIDSDPSLMVYHQQQGVLFAQGGAFERAAESFARAADLAPEYALNFVNQAAALAQLGRWDEAVVVQQRAITAAPDEPRFAYPLAIYAENAGVFDLARAAYQRVLAKYPDMPLLSGWNDSPLRAELASTTPLSADGEIARLLMAGDPAAAGARLTQAQANGETLYLAIPLDALIALENNTPTVPDALPAIWRSLYNARRAQLTGDSAAPYLAEIDPDRTNAHDALIDALLPNINYVQFLRLTFPNVWIEQVMLPPNDAVFTALYEWVSRE